MCAQRRLRSAWASPPVWSESSLSAWRKLRYLATEHTAKTLIWVFAGGIDILLILSWGGSNIKGHHFDLLIPEKNSFFKRFFNHIQAWQPTWACNRHHLNQLSFPPVHKGSTWNLTFMRPAAWEMFENINLSDLGERLNNDLDLW